MILSGLSDVDSLPCTWPLGVMGTRTFAFLSMGDAEISAVKYRYHISRNLH